MKKTLLYFVFQTVLAITVSAQLTVSTAMSPEQLVQNILSVNGVNVSNVTYTGNPGSIGYFSTGSVSTNLGLSSGIILSSGFVNGTPSIGSPVSNFSSGCTQSPGDTDLQSLVVPLLSYDAAVLEFDFVTLADTVEFRYVFGSEEYPEYVSIGTDDVFGFFISGENPLGGSYNNANIAILPDTNLAVSVNTINAGFNSEYYVDNQALGGQSIVYDGFTKVLTAWCLVKPCMTYHLKVAICDVGDSIFDSGVFLEAHSFSAGNLYTPIVLQANVSDQVACSMSNADFTISALSPDTLYYQWQVSYDEGNSWTSINARDTMPVYAGYHSDHLTLTQIPDSCNANWYRCLVSDSSCMPIIISDSVQLFVTADPPFIGAIVGDSTLCQGMDSVIYSVPANNYTSEYFWTIPQGASAISYGNTIVVYYSDTAVSDSIIVVGRNDCGLSNVQYMNIHVLPKPAIPLISQNGTVLTSSPADSYQWYYNGDSIAGATTQSITMTGSGNYQVMVFNSSGCSSVSDMINWSGMGVITELNYVKLFPNPSSDLITLECPEFKNVMCRFYSLDGKLVLQQLLQSDRTILDVSGIEQGFYFIKVTGQDINVTLRLIKK